MFKKLYDTFIFKYPLLVLLLSTLFVSILGYYATKVEIDASAETLLLDDDKDLMFFRVNYYTEKVEVAYSEDKYYFCEK